MFGQIQTNLHSKTLYEINVFFYYINQQSSDERVTASKNSTNLFARCAQGTNHIIFHQRTEKSLAMNRASAVYATH